MYCFIFRRRVEETVDSYQKIHENQSGDMLGSTNPRKPIGRYVGLNQPSETNLEICWTKPTHGNQLRNMLNQLDEPPILNHSKSPPAKFYVVQKSTFLT